MLAERDMARHQSFDGFVGVEESIRAKKERQSRSKGCDGNGHEHDSISQRGIMAANES